jgi:hypothetical protein
MPSLRLVRRSPLPSEAVAPARAVTMTQHEALERLEQEWQWPDGFFARLHTGDFSARAARRIADVLANLELADDAAIDRRLVAQLWCLPREVERRLERVADHQGDVEGCRAFAAEVTRLLEDKLGVP